MIVKAQCKKPGVHEMHYNKTFAAEKIICSFNCGKEQDKTMEKDFLQRSKTRGEQLPTQMHEDLKCDCAAISHYQMLARTLYTVAFCCSSITLSICIGLVYKENLDQQTRSISTSMHTQQNGKGINYMNDIF